MSTSIDPRRYLLPNADSEQIFRERITPRELAAAQAVDTPVVVFVAGQPGAGKTKTTEAVVDSLQGRGGATVVNSDFYKPYHPEYDRLLATDDTTAAPYTSLDGRRWMAMAEEYLIEHRANVVVETTMRDPGDFQEPAAMFRRAGYQVEVAVMAVPEALSRIGILARYEQQVAASGSGRLTETSNHDASYAGVSRALQQIDVDRIVDRVSVWRRGNELLYANHLTTEGQWAHSARAVAALEAERSRPFTPEQTGQFLRDLRWLAASHSPAVRAQLPSVQALARPLIPADARAATLDALTATRPKLGGPPSRVDLSKAPDSPQSPRLRH